ncbi:MAG: LON peptidase substrate-binding domain-containing protein [Parvularculaceae bacterium]
MRTELPTLIPIFPLPGALLLPRGRLPLNIFEPRYLDMVDDALCGARIIGMIQPRPDGALYSVGGAGRITSFSETPDGRYLITLTRARRFRLVEEIPADTSYRQARVDWSPYEKDLETSPAEASGSEIFACGEFLSCVRKYLESHEFSFDWECIENATPEKLVNSLAMICPFSVEEKQALLEAETLEARAQSLIALMRMAMACDRGADGGCNNIQ